MRISYKKVETQISGLNNGFNIYGTPIAVIVGGVPVAMNGKLCKGVKDITQYKTVLDEDGNKQQVEIVPEEIPEEDKLSLPTIENLKWELVAFCDAYGITYNAGDTKQDLVDKIHRFYGLPM